MNTPKYLIVHHTGGTDKNPLADTSNQTFDIVDAYHKSLGWGKIGYHYFIDKAGKTTQGRQDDEEGAHTKGKNLESIGICLAGNFDFSLPSGAQIEALKRLLKDKYLQYKIPLDNIVPHRQFSTKTCYGTNLPNDWAGRLCGFSVLSWLNELLRSLLKGR